MDQMLYTPLSYTKLDVWFMHHLYHSALENWN